MTHAHSNASWQRSLTTVDIDQLRRLRSLLVSDTDRVSYLVRLVESRISMLTAGKPVEAIAPRVVASVLEQTKGFAKFTGYRGPLPEATGMWTLGSSNSSTAQMVMRDCRLALKNLSSYRAYQKEQASLLTTELISRYQADLSLIDSLLPKEPNLADS